MTPIIVADQLTKWYGPRLAVDRVSLEVEAGEVLGLLGPNGSGKTTILRLLTGYLRPSSGTARVAGLDVVDDTLEARKHVGYVPEDTPLYEGMRVREFLTFMAHLKGLDGRTLLRAVDGASGRLGLADVRKVPIGRLSRGYRQRVAIAQALLGSPPLLILDEPTNGLDPRQIIEMRDLMRSLSGDHTILVTSHILGEIEKVVDRVAILLNGRLLATHTVRGEARGQRLRLRVRGPEEEVRARLEAVPGVRQVTVDEEAGMDVATYVVEAEAVPVAEALTLAVVGEGFGLLELREAPVELESLFLQLTRSGGAPA
jgi:ABC-2 type transport system ATP-binding protein